MLIAQGPSLAAVEVLLKKNDLPIADLGTMQSSDFLYCGQIESPTGVIGLQIADSAGLLRSLVVSEDGRHKGCGTALVAALESKAMQAGVRDLYLLTQTAEAFFENLHYAVIPRNNAPTSIRNTAEFDSLCPGDATLMYKQLGQQS